MVGPLAWLLMMGAQPVEGAYVAQQHETATVLELEADGRYRWFYSQGALDLSSEGAWAMEEGTIILTSDPVKLPLFTFSGSRRGDNQGLLVRVLTSSGEPIPAVDVMLRYRSGKATLAPTDSQGEHRFDSAAGDPLDHVALALPLFELRSPDFKLSATAGDTLTFELEPNDIGKQVFVGERLSITEKGLVLAFRGSRLTYARQEDGIEEVP